MAGASFDLHYEDSTRPRYPVPIIKGWPLDPNPSTNTPPHTFLYHKTSGNTTTLTPISADVNNPVPTYDIHNAAHGFSKEPNITITHHSSSTLLGTIRFHTFGSKIDLKHPPSAPVTYKVCLPHPTLGLLYWRIIAVNRTKGIVGCHDANGEMVASVALKKKMDEGRLDVYRSGLSQQDLELVVLSAVAETDVMRRKASQGQRGRDLNGVEAWQVRHGVDRGRDDLSKGYTWGYGGDAGYVGVGYGGDAADCGDFGGDGAGFAAGDRAGGGVRDGSGFAGFVGGGAFVGGYAGGGGGDGGGGGGGGGC